MKRVKFGNVPWKPTVNALGGSKAYAVLAGRATRNLEYEPTTGASTREDYYDGTYKGRFKGWRITCHSLRLHSAYYISRSERTLWLSFDMEDNGRLVTIQRKFVLPKSGEWRWVYDTHGIGIVRRYNAEQHYHPTTDEFRSARNCRLFIVLAVTNYRKREQERLEALRQEDNERLMLTMLKTFGVSLQDSIRAGNCKQGTIQFAKSLGVVVDENNPFQTIPADLIWGKSRLADAAVRKAFQRVTCVSI